MYTNEAMTSYFSRIVELFYTISNANTMGENEDDSKIIREALKNKLQQFV